MRTRAVLGSIFVSGVVLFLGWQAGTVTTNSAGITPSSGPTSSGTNTGPSSSSPTSPSAIPSGAATTPATAGGSSGGGVSGTFAGDTAQTQFGPMQVEIVVAGGKITDVKTLQITNLGDRSTQISNYADPILRQEVLAAQSAHVNSVSGATYTSDGYLTSLQSALDKAKL